MKILKIFRSLLSQDKTIEESIQVRTYERVKTYDKTVPNWCNILESNKADHY